MKRRYSVLTLTAFVIGIFSAMPALANDSLANDPIPMPDELYDVGGNRIHPTVEPLSEEDIAHNAAFDEMVENIRAAYESYYKGEITIDQLQQIEDENYFAVYPEEKDNPEASMKTNTERREMVESVKEEQAQGITTFGIEPFNLGDGTYHYLGMPYEMQATDYWCGPATATNIVNGYNGKTVISQSWAASQLGTTKNGTNLGNNWKNALNANTMGKTYNVAWGSYGWAADLANKCISTIYNGRGVVLNVVMTPSTTYLPGYNSSMGNVYHYVAAYGFDSQDPSRRKISYIDPNGYVPAAAGAHTVTFQQMALATQTNGIVY